MLFNCSESFTSDTMVRYLRGMVSSGSLGCFENADSLPLALLSLFAQHVADIRDSLSLLTNGSLMDGQQNKIIAENHLQVLFNNSIFYFD